jgi:hypothetical protein
VTPDIFGTIYNFCPYGIVINMIAKKDIQLPRPVYRLYYFLSIQSKKITNRKGIIYYLSLT